MYRARKVRILDYIYYINNQFEDDCKVQGIYQQALCMKFAVAVIDLKTNSVVKCRTSIEEVFDLFCL